MEGLNSEKTAVSDIWNIDSVTVGGISMIDTYLFKVDKNTFH